MTTEQKAIDVSTGDGWSTGANENMHRLKQTRVHAPSLTLTLQESQDVLLADGALHVTDDRPAGVVHELDTDLRDTTTGASAAKDLNGGERAQNNRQEGCRGRGTVRLWTLITVASLTGAFDES